MSFQKNVDKKLTRGDFNVKILKEKIINLFYFKHLKVKDIADTLHVSSAYITKIIKQDNRYIEEKETRKKESKKNRKLAQNKFVREKREQKRIEDNYAILQVQHVQAVKEMSKSNYLTNENYRKWNSGAYKYNPVKKQYEFDETLGRAYAVPKIVKER